MTIKQLKQLISDYPDDMEVLVPATKEFDGRFYSPCPEESGEADIKPVDPEALYQNPTEAILNPHREEEESFFLLLPCGFLDQRPDHKHLLN